MKRLDLNLNINLYMNHKVDFRAKNQTSRRHALGFVSDPIRCFGKTYLISKCWCQCFVCGSVNFQFADRFFLQQQSASMLFWFLRLWLHIVLPHVAAQQNSLRDHRGPGVQLRSKWWWQCHLINNSATWNIYLFYRLFSFLLHFMTLYLSNLFRRWSSPCIAASLFLCCVRSCSVIH